MSTKLIWHRYRLTKRGNCRRLRDRKTKRECQIGGAVNEKLINQSWKEDPYQLWSSATSSPPLYCKEKTEKNRPPSEGEVETRTHWQICLWRWWWPSVISPSHTSLPRRESRIRVHACSHVDTHRPWSWRVYKNWFYQLPSIYQGEIGHSFPFTMCCSYPSLCFYISICGAPVSPAMREATGLWQKGDDMRQTITPQWTSHLSPPAQISHLLWPSVRKDYMLVGYKAADMPALTQAPLHCLWKRYMHAYMNAVMT